jgi:cytoskeleton protein RodZ
MNSQSIGQRLKRARESRGASIYEAARETKIRVDYLESMERDSFRFVSGGTYVRGMLRTYGQWLGLQAGDLLADYDPLYGSGAGPSLAEIFKEPAQPAPRSRQRLWGIAAVVAATLLLFLSLIGILNPPRTRVASIPRPARTATPPPSPPVPLAQAPTVVLGVKLTVRVTGDKCWMRVIADGNRDKPVFEGTLSNGAAQTFEATQVLDVFFGRLGAIQISVNGTDIPIPEELGETGRFLFYPDTKSLQRASGPSA